MATKFYDTGESVAYFAIRADVAVGKALGIKKRKASWVSSMIDGYMIFCLKFLRWANISRLNNIDKMTEKEAFVYHGIFQSHMFFLMSYFEKITKARIFHSASVYNSIDNLLVQMMEIEWKLRQKGYKNKPVGDDKDLQDFAYHLSMQSIPDDY